MAARSAAILFWILIWNALPSIFYVFSVVSVDAALIEADSF